MFKMQAAGVAGVQGVCSAYDCEFAALAMGLSVKLVTMDRELLNAFPEHAVSLTAG